MKIVFEESATGEFGLVEPSLDELTNEQLDWLQHAIVLLQLELHIKEEP